MTIVLSSTLIAGGTAGTIAFSDSSRTTGAKDNDKPSVAQEIPEEAAKVVSRNLPIATLESAASDPVAREVRPTLGMPSVELNLKENETDEETRRLTIPATLETRNTTAENPGLIHLAQAQVTITPPPRPASFSNSGDFKIPWDPMPAKKIVVPPTGNTLSPALQAPANLWAPVLVRVKPQKKKVSDENERDDVGPPSPLNPSIITSPVISPISGGAIEPGWEATNPPGGSTTPLYTPPVNPAGIFPNLAPNRVTVDPHQRIAKFLLIYLHDLNTPDMYSAPSMGFGTNTAYQYLQKLAIDQNQWIAANSGGKMGLQHTILDSGALGNNPSTGLPWGSPYDALNFILANNGINGSDYDYYGLVYDNMQGSYDSPYFSNQNSGGTATGGPAGSFGKYWAYSYSHDHEFGHLLGFGHAKRYFTADTPSYSYTYDFTTRQYVAGTAVSNGTNAQMAPMGLYLKNVEYGNPTDVMAGGNYQYGTRDKLKAGWMDKRQVGIITPGANGTTTNVTIHNPDELAVVTNGQAGDAQRYGVASGYAQTPYMQTFARKALKFIPNTDGKGNRWVSTVQVVDLNYTQLTTGPVTYGVEVRIDGAYYGTLQLNQIISEKDFGRMLLLQDTGAVGQNPPPPYDLSALDTVGPDNPNRFASSSYDIRYLSDNTDGIGDFATLAITTHLGSTASGLRWNTGAGTWQTGGGNLFTDIDNANAAAAWADGRHAVFGDPSLAAATVTVSGTVAPKSLTFKPSLSGNYTITGGTISLGSSGMNVEASATIASTLSLSDIQAWEILGGNTLTLSGTVNANGNDLDVLGAGTLALTGSGTYGNLSIYGNTVNQTASQTVSRLNLYQSSAWNVNGGTLTIDGTNGTGSDKDPGLDGRIVLNSAASSAAAPELMVKGGADLLSDLQINAGTHFVGMNGNTYLMGALTGSGELAIAGSADDKSFQLNNAANTFSGDFRVMRGILAVRDYGRLNGTNDLVFDVALGQKGEFRTGANGTTLASLSTAGTHAGTATVSNNSAFDATLTVNQSANTTYSGRIIDGSTGKLALNKTGTGMLTLTGGNGTYTGGTTVSQGTLRIGGGASIGTGAVTLAGGTFSVDWRQAAALSVANAVSIAENSTIEILDTNVIQAETRLTGVVSGSGNLTKTGSGILTLANAGNTYTGAITVSGGTLAAGATNVFSSASAITLANTAGVALDLRGFNQTVGSLAGGGTTGGNVTLGSATLTAGGDNTSTAFAGVISGTGGLTKAGTGTMSLSGQNTYTGATTVTGGVLNLDYSANALTSNLVNSASTLVLDGGVLRVTGRSGATITQNFASLTLLDGANGINLVSNGATSLDVDIGAITRSGTGTLDFSGLTGSAVGARVKTTPGTAGTLLDGGAQWATYNGTDWASRDTNGYIIAYTGYTDIYNGTGSGSVIIPNTSGADVRIREAVSGYTNNTLAATTTTIKSLLMSAGTTAATVDIAGKTLSVEAIAAASNAKRLMLGATANSGMITSSTNKLQFVSNNGAATEGIVVNSVIADNAGTPLAVSVSGGVNGGTTYFAATNTYTGGTTITNNGILSISATGALGANEVTVTSGATLVLDGSGTFAVGNAIGGAGALTKLGSNLVSLSGTNTYTGTTTISDGTLRVNDGASIGTGAIINNASFIYNCSNTVTLANTISGTGSLTKSNTGTLILTGSNSYGATVINAGTLQIGAVGTTGSLGTGSVTGTAGTLAFNRTDTITVANAIGGGVSLAQIGSGTVTLTGANTYSGTTSISNGTQLSVGAGGTSGTLGTGAVTNNGTLIFNRSDALTVSASIGGTGSVIHDGLGTTTLTGANTYSGTTTIDAGATLQVGSGGGTGTLGSGAVTLDGALVFNRSGTLTVSATISGSGNISQNGSGTTVITSDNALYFGTVTINSGALQFGDGGTTGSLTYAPLVNNSSLIFKRSDTIKPISAISGTGSLTQSGSGTLILSKNNTYAGTTTIDAGGTLQVGDGGTAGTLGGGAVTDNGTLIFNRSNDFTVNNLISGAGNLVQAGTGTTYLSAANTYTGTTTIDAGAIRLLAGATLGSGDVLLNAGKLIFNPGTSGSVTLANRIAMEGGTLQIVNQFVPVTLNGEVAVGAGGGSFITHDLQGFTINGPLTGSGALSLTNGNAFNGIGTVKINNASNTYSGTLSVGTTAGSSDQPLLVIGANTALRFATLNLAPTATRVNEVAFATGVTAPIIGGLSGNATSGMKLQTSSTPLALTVDQVANTTFAGILSGTGSLTKAGVGTLSLSGQNTYTGGTTVTGGILALDFSASGSPSTNILAATGAVTLNGGTLRIIGKSGQTGTVQTFVGLTSGSAASTLELVQNGATTLDVNVGALSFGTGTLTFAGLTGDVAGARVITSTNAGANDGATQLAATSALWNGGGWASVKQVSGVNYIVQWNGTYSDVYTNAAGGKTTVIPNAGANGAIRILENGVNTTHNTLAASSTTINSLLMTANVNGSTIDMGASDKLTILGSGNVAMTSDAKSLTIGNVAGQGTLTSGNSGAATLNLSNSNAASLLTVNADIADNGSGAVSLATAGKVTLNGDLSYSGNTTVGSGSTLTANTLLGGGNYTANIVNNGVLSLNGAGVQNFSGVLSGSGTTTVANGVLRLGVASALSGGAVTFASGSALDLNGFNAGTASVTLSGTGSGSYAALNNTAAGTTATIGPITLAGDATVGGAGATAVIAPTTLNLAGHTLSASNVRINLPGDSSLGAGNLVGNAGSIFYISGSKSGAGAAGTITLNTGSEFAVRDYDNTAVTSTKTIILNGGMISNGNVDSGGGAQSTLANAISVGVNGGTLNGDNWGFSRYLRLSGAITGSGSLTAKGAMGVELRGDTSGFTGGINIAGTGTDLLMSGSNQTLSGVLSGTGSLTMSGSGTLTLSGANTYTGATAINSGALAITGTGSLGAGAYTGALALASGTSFNYASSANQTLSGVVSGAGTVNMTGTGTLSLTGANTYAGGTTVTSGTLAFSNSSLGSGNVGMNGGALRWNTGNTQDISAKLTMIAGKTATLDTNGNNVAFANGIGGGTTAGLTKNGAGTLTLSGANTYTGATAVNSGALVLNGSLGDSAVTVASGASFGGSGTLGSGVTKSASLNFQTGSNLLYAGAALTLNGNLSFAGANKLAFDFTPVSGTQYTIVNYSGSLTNGTNLTAGYRGVLDLGTGSNSVIKFTASGGATALTWTGASNATWGVSDGYNNFVHTAAPSTSDNFYLEDSVTFDDSAPNKTVNLVGQLKSSAINVNHTAGTYTFGGTGQITGVTGINKSGAGTLVITGTHTFTGASTLRGGVTQIASDGSLGLAPGSAVANQLTLDNTTLSAGADLTLATTRGITLASSSTVDTNGFTVNYGGVITGTGPFVKSGAGTLSLSGLNTYSGGTTVNAGTLDLAVGGSTGAIRGAVTVNSGAILQVSAANALGTSSTSRIGALTLNGGALNIKNTGNNSITSASITMTGGTITGISGSKFDLRNNGTSDANIATVASSVTSVINIGTLGMAGGNSTWTVAKGSTASGTDLDVSSVIVDDAGTGGSGSGIHRLSKAGAGTLRLSGANSFTGGVSLLAGKLITANTSALGTGNVSVATGATLQIGDGVNNGVTLGSAATLAMATDATLKLGASDSKVTMGSGAFTLASGVNLDITGVTLGVGSYTVISGTSASSAVGTWNMNTDLLGGDFANFAYTFAKVGNDAVFTVTAVPEPATYGLLGAASLAAVAMVRRRRRAVVLP